MAKKEHIDDILRNWPYKPGVVMARWAKGEAGRDVIQMRVEMGLLQMEAEGRPDGEHPEGSETYFDHLVMAGLADGDKFRLTEEQCGEIDREFVQFYHRRICWLALREFGRAMRDADHTLALMDFSTAHATDERWILSHEQYRPFVLFHRIQAAALCKLEEEKPEGAVEELDAGLVQFRELFTRYDGDGAVEDDELFKRLAELKESIRERFDMGPSLLEQLAAAVQAENYEQAALLRDEIARRKTRR